MTIPLLFTFAVAAPTTLLDHAWEAFRADGEVRIEDAYKWLFHATMGGEHAVHSEEGPRVWLQNEWNHLPNVRDPEPLVVSLRPDGSVLRVNLRPYKRAGRDPEMLLQLFVASAQTFKADRTAFRAEWSALGRRLSREPVGHLTYPEWRRLERQTGPLGYPAIHHSKAFEEARRPAYRVISGSLWQ